MTSAPAAAKAYPGVMKMPRAPLERPRRPRPPRPSRAPARTSCPTATIRRPSPRAASIAAAAVRAAPRTPRVWRAWSARSSAVTGRNVSSPTPSVTSTTSMPAPQPAHSSAVKCSPAVGAAAEPGRARVDGLVVVGIGRAARWMYGGSGISPTRSSAGWGPGMAPPGVTAHAALAAARSTTRIGVARASASRRRAAGGPAGRARPSRRRDAGSSSSTSTAPPRGAAGAHPHRQHAGVVQRPPGRRARARRAGPRSGGAGSHRVARSYTRSRALSSAARPASGRSGRWEGRSRARRCAQAGRIAGRSGRGRRPGRCGTRAADAQRRRGRQVPARAGARPPAMWTWPPRHEPFTWKSMLGRARAVGVLDHRALRPEPEAGDDAELLAPRPGRSARRHVAGKPKGRALRRALDRAQAELPRRRRAARTAPGDQRDPRTAGWRSIRGITSAGRRSEEARVARRRGQPQVGVPGRRDDPAARRPLEQAQLEQVRLVDVLERVGLLADRDGQRREADRAAREPLGDRRAGSPGRSARGRRGRPRTGRAPRRRSSWVIVALRGAPGRSRAPGAGCGWRPAACRANGARSRRSRRRRSRTPSRRAERWTMLLDLAGVVVVEPVGDAEPVAQRRRQQAGARGRADQRERLQLEPDRVGARAPGRSRCRCSRPPSPGRAAPRSPGSGGGSRR